MFWEPGISDQVALIVDDGEPLTYAALRELVDRRAGRLRAAGVERATRAALIPSTGDSLIGLLAIMRCGIALPLNPSLAAVDARERLASLKPDVLLVEPDSPADLIEAAREAGVRMVAWPREEDGGAEDPGPLPLPGHKALVLETSGTSGRPKRVPLTHANLEASAGHIRHSMQLGGDDRFLCIARLHHIAGIALALASLSAGSVTCCAPGLHPAAFFERFDAFRPTWFWAAPAILHALMPLAEARRNAPNGARLRFIRSGSASLPTRTLERAEAAFGAPVLENYGMTETAPQITSSPLPPGRRKPGSAGIAAGPELRIVVADGLPAAPGVEGEIQVRGANVTAGYEDDPEANAAAFDGGWFRTGDIGRLDEDGYLYVSGRRDDRINRGGEKIWPREVESALLAHPRVVEAVVFPVAHERLTEDVAAAVVVEGEAPEEAALRRFVAARLAPFKVPARIVTVPEIPKGPGGKPRRRSLAAELRLLAGESNGPARGGFVPLSTPLEHQLAAIWTKTLRVERVGAGDDFFDLGGDSLAVTAMLAEVVKQFGCGGGLRQRADFFEESTIAAQARSLEKELQARGPRPADRLPPEVSFVSPRHAGALGAWRADPHRPPVFIVPWAESDGQYFADLVSQLGDDWPCCVLLNPLPGGKPYSIEDLAARFVDRIVRAQPEGPYVIVGHCFGGHVAYDIARQLQASGRRVRLLAILDSPRPAYPSLIRHGHLFAAGALYHAWKAVRTGNAAGEVRLAATSLVRHIRKHGRGSIERIAANVGSGSALRAMRMYRPGPLRAPALMLISRDHRQTGSPLDRRIGWLTLIEPRPRYAVVEGDHHSMVGREHAAAIIAHLTRALQTTA